jgi:hypothetical protein
MKKGSDDNIETKCKNFAWHEDEGVEESGAACNNHAGGYTSPSVP